MSKLPVYFGLYCPTALRPATPSTGLSGHLPHSAGSISKSSREPGSVWLPARRTRRMLARALSANWLSWAVHIERTLLRQFALLPGIGAGIPCSGVKMAAQLVVLGPEYHGEAAEHLLEIVSCTNPEIRRLGWDALRNIGAELRSRAAAEFFELSGPDEAVSWESCGVYWVPGRSDVDDHDSLIVALTALLRDPSRGLFSRVSAASKLCYLGKEAGRAGLAGTIELLRSGVVPATLLVWIAGHFDYVASGQRAELAEAMRAMCCLPDPSAKAVCELAKAMERLGSPRDPGIIAALRSIVADNSVEPDSRSAAAVALARAVPEETPAAVAMVLDVGDRSSYPWEDHVRELAMPGGDVVPGSPFSAVEQRCSS